MAAVRSRAAGAEPASEPVSYGALRTPWGNLWVVASRDGLVALSFRHQPAGRLAEGLARRVPVVFTRGQRGLARYEAALTAFLDGRTNRLDLPVDLRGVGVFAQRVYAATRAIPWGELRSYAEIAEQVESRRHARAVGQALAGNPVPIVIPCHRVVASQGALGGFSAGLAWKRRLLALERGQQVLEV
jgi:methylated-DNA-[protein]-cysteine S-methyltransferase